MAWDVTVDGVTRRVVVLERGPDRVRVTVDGQPRALTVRRPEAGLVEVDGRRAWIAGQGDVSVDLDGRRWTARVEDPRSKALAALGGAGAGDLHIATSMPGKVVTVLVVVGDVVQAGQGIVVVEAMKMENELRAAVPGTVSAIHVQPGQAVEGGALLVELSPA